MVIKYNIYKNYLIFSNAQVFSVKNKKFLFQQRVMKRCKEYLRVYLYDDGRREQWALHRLVAMLFLGDIEGMEVNHKNRDTLDCNLDNLEIVTPSENQKHWRNT